MKSKNFKNSFSQCLPYFQQRSYITQYVNTPPEVSPMQMKPEMTEIWEPEVKVITPAKTH
jgi:hypothetical protein